MPVSPLSELRNRYLQGQTRPVEALDNAFAASNANASKNTYIAQNKGWSEAEASRLHREDAELRPLYGIPVSLKDCFDLAGWHTSAGSRFYESQPAAKDDSTVAARVRKAGAVITGKTHMHQLAYGITGENADFGDCLQPANAALLTGGSSSGGAASVQEGSALAAIGTDTGGSVRVPAALCGLAGYRSSRTVNSPEIWRGGYHLSESMDTVGWLYRDLRDGPVLGQALFNLELATPQPIAGLRIGTPDDAFLGASAPAVANALSTTLARLSKSQAVCTRFDASMWNSALDIYSPIVAVEAAKLHRGHFNEFEPVIAARLQAGANTSPEHAAELFAKMDAFRASTTALFDRFDYLLYPCAPLTELRAGADHTAARGAILRYTTPISLAGLPVVTLPFPGGAGLQLIGPHNSDATLLAVSTALAELL